MTASPSAWRAVVDETVATDRSILLRYHDVFDRLDLQIAAGPEELARCSIREGARVFSLCEHRGVEVLVCDESTLMATGTYKDLDACLISAIASRAGLDRAVVSSGGNLGYALSAYGRRGGMDLYFFQPKSTLFKLDASHFEGGGIHLISVDLPERQVKSLATAFSRSYAIREVPDIRWRLAASAVRALFILEATEQLDRRVDFLAQAMCAGYGPAGIYNCFSELSREGLLRSAFIPRFLGFQQEANAPMVRAWSSGDREISPRHIAPDPNGYIEPGLYNTNPERNYTRLFDLMRYYGGEMLPITVADYERYSAEIVRQLGAAGMTFTTSPSGEILEKTGLLTGVGIWKAIEEGRVRRGERVLYMLTGGFRRRASAEVPTPEATVDASKPEDEWVRVLGERFGLRPPEHRRRDDLLFR